jgi:hypothetical protein
VPLIATLNWRSRSIVSRTCWHRRKRCSGPQWYFACWFPFAPRRFCRDMLFNAPLKRRQFVKAAGSAPFLFEIVPSLVLGLNG